MRIRGLCAYSRIMCVFEDYVRILSLKLGDQYDIYMGLGEEGQTQQFLVRATYSLFSRSSHLGVLVHRLFCVKVSNSLS